VTYANQAVRSVDIVVVGTVGNSVRQIQASVAGEVLPSSLMKSKGGVTFTASGSGGGIIQGDVDCTGSCDIDTPEWTIMGSETEGAIPPPPPDMAAILALTTSTHSGTLTITGDYTGFVHVTGEVDISGGGTITGIIYSDNSIYLEMAGSDIRDLNGTLASNQNVIGNWENTSDGIFTAEGGLPVIAANGNIQMTLENASGGLVLNGRVEAVGNIQFFLSGNTAVDLNGNIAAQGNVQVNSSASSEFNVSPTSMEPSLTLSEWKET